MTQIIIPDRPRLLPDPFIAPINGERGPCALCQQYSDLTENHVPPESVGNFGFQVARSYLIASGANKDLYRGRAFKGGLRFRTLCAICNNGLGGREDRAIAAFFDRVRKLLSSPVWLPPVMTVPAKPNLIFRGLLAHLVSANDSGIPTFFDEEARELFFGRKELKSSSWSLFYWLYSNDSIFVMRDAFHAVWHPLVEVRPVQVLKCDPLAFLFIQEPWFAGLPNMRSFLQPRDDDEIDLPILMRARDTSEVWPVIPKRNNLILLAGSSFGLISSKK